jgi:hypothetical protein
MVETPDQVEQLTKPMPSVLGAGSVLPSRASWASGVGHGARRM